MKEWVFMNGGRMRKGEGLGEMGLKERGYEMKFVFVGIRDMERGE